MGIGNTSHAHIIPNAKTSRGTACGNMTMYSSTPLPGKRLRWMIQETRPVSATPMVAVATPSMRLLVMA